MLTATRSVALIGEAPSLQIRRMRSQSLVLEVQLTKLGRRGFERRCKGSTASRRRG
jgi:hypothetical protein